MNTPQVNAPLSQDEMKNNLHSLFASVTDKFSKFNSQSFAQNKKLTDSKTKATKQAFDVIRSMGVDPTNAQAVGGFLDKVRTSNPVLYQNLEKGLSGLIQ